MLSDCVQLWQIYLISYYLSIHDFTVLLVHDDTAELLHLTPINHNYCTYTFGHYVFEHPKNVQN